MPLSDQARRQTEEELQEKALTFIRAFVAGTAAIILTTRNRYEAESERVTEIRLKVDE